MLNCPLKVATILRDTMKRANANEKGILVVKDKKDLRIVTRNVLMEKE